MSAEHHSIQDASQLHTWRKSSYSGGGDEKGGDSCVEVADGLTGVMPVRDSKAPHGPALVFPAGAWAAFIEDVKSGR
jgi:uncharacterized protein DUF397